MTCFLTSASRVSRSIVLGVLRGEHDGVDADRAVVGVVLDGDLGLAVRAQVGQRAVLADLGELLGEALGHHDRQRHQHVGVVAGVAEHQPLVAGALLVHRVHRAGAALVAGVDALGDVAGLAADGDHDAAGGAVEALRGRVVADLEDPLAHDLLDVDVAGGGDLAGHDDEAGGQQGLDRDPAVRVLAQHLVEDRVADLVGDLVGVTLGHRLRGEQTSWHGVVSWFVPEAVHPRGVSHAGPLSQRSMRTVRWTGAGSIVQPGGHFVPNDVGQGGLGAARDLGGRAVGAEDRRPRCRGCRRPLPR